MCTLLQNVSFDSQNMQHIGFSLVRVVSMHELQLEMVHYQPYLLAVHVNRVSRRG